MSCDFYLSTMDSDEVSPMEDQSVSITADTNYGLQIGVNYGPLELVDRRGKLLRARRYS